MAVPRDVQIFLAGYPGAPNDTDKKANLDFYRNERPMMPEGLTYDAFMRRYSRDYEELEANHGYIQWLFPIPEQGVNYRAQPLQQHELQAMIADESVIDRLLRSYSMMMAFYGIKVDRANQNRLSLADDHKARLRNLTHAPHNLLRLTRILKLLALFPPLSSLAAPHVLFFTALHSEGHLDLSPSIMHGQSLERWWVNCLKDEGEREVVREIVEKRGGKGEVKWGMKEWEGWFEARQAQAGEA
ncbi:opioid growth factor receptor conserved domain-containing protein [Dioszegia hungarica]|uniref:Opioid growth factor receptor conserved domain-containing protein n=1 Tax=Dioszegia hungarica TaxID=4972 RepID=A0AA38H802_9TREE|nr:opioid growth factor receptor conserved domain-containing protein [Dioszegia hungarica]KAI9635903.1 opioid growth factor receptor conserved domain-containing protein [Dioszegia hungarica]